jgi:hypothetical protein
MKHAEAEFDAANDRFDAAILTSDERAGLSPALSSSRS